MVDPRVCPHCGARSDDPVVEAPASRPRRAVVRCRACGRGAPFAHLPLYCLTGPSGTGKSTVARLVAPRLAPLVVTLEQDVLWDPALAHEEGGVERFRSRWLHLAAMIGQSGRPVLLCGTVAPQELEALPARSLFSAVHLLGLTCDADVLAARLRGRPAWRGWDEARISEMVQHSRWFAAMAPTVDPPVRLLDTTSQPVSATAAEVAAWVEALERSRS